MSIINEALKKTEQYIQKKADKENIPVSTKHLPRPVLLYALILLAGLFLANIIFNLLRYKVTPGNIREKSITLDQPVAPLPQAREIILPKEEAASLPSEQKFVLNGIFFSDNDGYALVNNQIVRENDLVDGAKVQKITSGSVELNQEGKITTLTTSR